MSLSQEFLEGVKEEAREYLLTQGVLINAKPAPIALFPTPFPRRLFELYPFSASPLPSFLIHSLARL